MEKELIINGWEKLKGTKIPLGPLHKVGEIEDAAFYNGGNPSNREEEGYCLVIGWDGGRIRRYLSIRVRKWGEGGWWKMEIPNWWCWDLNRALGGSVYKRYKVTEWMINKNDVRNMSEFLIRVSRYVESNIWGIDGDFKS